MSRGSPKPLRTRKESYVCVYVEKTPESHLNSKEIEPINLKGNQP